MKYSYMEIRLNINHKPRNKEYEKWIKEFIAKFNYEEISNIKINKHNCKHKKPAHISPSSNDLYTSPLHTASTDCVFLYAHRI